MPSLSLPKWQKKVLFINNIGQASNLWKRGTLRLSLQNYWQSWVLFFFGSVTPSPNFSHNRVSHTSHSELLGYGVQQRQIWFQTINFQTKAILKYVFINRIVNTGKNNNKMIFRTIFVVKFIAVKLLPRLFSWTQKNKDLCAYHKSLCCYLYLTSFEINWAITTSHNDMWLLNFL